MIALRGTARTRVGLLVGSVAAATLALSGCAAGQHAATAREIPVADGVEANIGDIAIRNMSVAPPPVNNYDKGGDAKLELYVVNNGPNDDQLTAVTSTVATSVDLYANAAAAADAAQSSPASAPSDSSSPAGGAASGTSIDVPAGKPLSIGNAASDPVIVLHNLTGQVFPAQSFPITLQFKNAGSVTVSVAVHLATPPSSPASAPTAVESADE